MQLDDDLGEVRYGEWTGQPLKSLSRDPLWKVVQQHPSAVTFPGDGEGLAAMQARAVASVRRWNAELGSDAVVRRGLTRRCHQGVSWLTHSACISTSFSASPSTRHH